MSHHQSDDTSDRLYTPEELDAFAAAEARAAAGGAHDWSRPAAPQGPPATASTTHRPDPLSDPLPSEPSRP